MNTSESTDSVSALHATSSNVLDTIYQVSSAIRGVTRFLQSTEADAYEAATLLEIVNEKLSGAASTLDHAIMAASPRDAELSK